MNTLSRAEIRRMKRIWSKVPPITGCKGLCWDSCANAPMHPVETLYLIERHGEKIDSRNLDRRNVWVLDSPCQFLTSENRCAIYQDRPLVCRLFGHPVGKLECRWGCTTANPLTQEQAALLMWEMANAANGENVQVSPEQMVKFTRERRLL